MAVIVDLLKKAKEKQSSDIHLKVGSKPIIRKNLKLYLLDKALPALTNSDIQKMIDPLMGAEVKELYKKNKSVDFGRFFSGLGRFRFCVFSQKGSLRVVIRTINESIASIKDLQIPSIITRLMDYKSGLVLITGATGSGKSSTAAALLDYVNKKYSYHIITIEDPIEYVLHDNMSFISQRELYLDYFNFQDALKSALRQDPDLIFIGEMRDAETVRIAIQAADSGHLVISTLHTSNAIETFDRCMSYFEGIDQRSIRIQLTNSLRGIISQKLIPAKNKKLIPIIEILFNNTRMKKALFEGKSAEKIKSILESSYQTWGMQSFDQNIVSLIKKNLIAEEVGIQYSAHPENIRLMCQGFSHSENTGILKSMEGTGTETNLSDSSIKEIPLQKSEKNN